MGTTSAGSIQMDLEVNAELNGDVEAQAKKIVNAIQKQLAGMKDNMFDNLAQSFEKAMEAMTQTIKKQTDASKRIMQSFIADMQAMAKNMKINTPSLPVMDDNTSKPTSVIPNQTAPRAPPVNVSSPKISIPKVKLDDQFDAEITRNNYDSLSITFDALSAKIDALVAKKKNLNKQFAEANLLKDVESATALKDEILKLDIQIKALGNKLEQTSITLDAMDRAQQEAASSARVMAKEGNAVTKSINMLSAAFQKLAQKAMALMKSGLHSIFNGFNNGAKKAIGMAEKIAKKMLGIGSAAKKSSSGMGHANMGLGRLIKSFFIFSMIFPIVSRGIMALGKSIGQSLMANEQFANSFNQIRSNLMAAFMPIYQAVLPALNALMSALAQITAHLASFISTLFGKTYKQSLDAASGLVTAKDAMGAYGNSAAKAAKQVKDALLPMDELNILQSQNNDDAGGGGSSAPVIIPTEFDPSGSSNLAQKIKAMFEAEDYAGIGKMIGEKINIAVASFTDFISWDRIGSKITSFVNAFCEIFNNLFATIDWNQMGSMVGTGINSVVNTIYLLLTGIDWKKCGRALALGLNGIVHKVDWKKLGNTIGSYFQARIDAIYGFVSTADWAGIGQALADGFMGIIDSFDFGLFATTLGTGISGAIGMIHNFITGIDWTGLGLIISETLNNFFASINWADMGTTFSDLALGLLETIRIALITTNWAQIGKDIATFLLKIDWMGLAMSLLDVIGSAISSLVQVVGSLMIEIAQALWDGLCGGVADFFSNVGKFIKDTIVDPFINAIKDFFGIHSPSTVMSEIGVFLIEGMMNGISSLINTLLSSVDGWFGGVSTNIKGIFSGIIDFITGVFTGNWSKAWEGVKKIFSNIVDGLVGIFKAPINGIIRLINSFIGGLNKIKIPDWVPGIGGKGIHISKLPYLARGGIIDKPTTAVIGEAGKEAVMPLERNTGWIDVLASSLSSKLSVVQQPTLAFAGSTPMDYQQPKNDNASDKKDKESIVVYLKELLNKLDQVKEAVDEIDPNAYIDGDDVTDVVTKKQKEREKRTGRR